MATESTVRTYTGRDQQAATEEYTKDAAKMAEQGWMPVGQSWADGRSGCLRVIMLGFIGALVWKPKGSLTVTYTR
jgi:hypothetical protein